jgi:hypothetical protein
MQLSVTQSNLIPSDPFCNPPCPQNQGGKPGRSWLATRPSNRSLLRWAAMGQSQFRRLTPVNEAAESRKAEFPRMGDLPQRRSPRRLIRRKQRPDPFNWLKSGSFEKSRPRLLSTCPAYQASQAPGNSSGANGYQREGGTSTYMDKEGVP